MIENSSFQGCEFGLNSSNHSCNVTFDGTNQVQIPVNEIENFIYFNIAPVFIIVGLVSNSLTCFIVNRPPLNAFSVSFYSLAYTISNILTLVLNFGVRWLQDMYNTQHFESLSENGCRIWQFIIRMITYSGVWFVVAMGVDRYIALWHPVRAVVMCTVFMAKIAVAIIIIFLMVLSIHAMWIYQTFNGWCGILDLKNDIFKYMWQWVSGMSYSTVPLAIMFVLANLIIVRLCLKHRGRQLPENVETEIELTMVVIVLCFVYFLCNTPATVINIYDNVRANRRQNAAELDSIRTITNLIWWANHTCLFFVAWCSCSKTFRNTLKATLVKCKNRLRRRHRTVELTMLTEETEEVQTDNTSV